MVIVISGVAGAGKTTVARALAERLHFELFEGDDFYTRASQQKVQSGTPLTDADRESWLVALSDLISDLSSCGVDGVVTSSALLRSDRDTLARQGVHFVFLRVSFVVAHARLQQRAGHFVTPALLASQFEALEIPDEGVTVDANQPVEIVVEDLLQRLQLAPA